MDKNKKKESSFLFLIALFTIWRDALFLTASVSRFLIPNFGDKFPYAPERLANASLTHPLWSFGNFDGVHYLGIAKYAYSDQYTQAFFPFYPVLIKLFSHLTNGNLLISALLISNIAFFAGIIMFYNLVTNFFNKNIAFWSCVFLVTFPTSFYFGSVYTESVFFLLIISSFYLLSKNRVIEASLVGAVASGTRLAGLFLAPAFMFSNIKRKFFSLVIIPLGFTTYLFFLKTKYNNPFLFLTSQRIFGQERSTDTIVLLPQVIFRYIKILLTTKGLLFTSALLEITATIFALTMVFLIRKKIPKEWFVFSLFTILIPTLTGTLTSMPRYIITAFPIYIALALIKSNQVKICLALAFSVLLFILTCLFTQGYWVA